MDTKIEPVFGFHSRKLKLVAALLFGAGLLLYLTQATDSNTLKVGKDRLKISTVENAEFQEYIPVRASVMPIETVFLDVTQGGRIEEVFVEEGDQIIKGQPLARISNSMLQLDVISREAQVSEQLNFLRNTRLSMEESLLNLQERRLEMDYDIEQFARKLSKNESVFKRGGISQEDITEQRAKLQYLKEKREVVDISLKAQQSVREVQLAQLENSATHLERNLEIARKNLEALTIKAMVDGQLSAFSPKVGQSLSDGERIGQVDDISDYKLEAYVDEFYITKVAVGRQARFQLQGREYLAELHKISPDIINGQFKVELNFASQKPTNLRRGQTLQLRLTLDDPAMTTLVAAGSYMLDTGGKWLYVLSADGDKAYKKEVRIGRSNPDYVEVLSGLSSGDKVITSGYQEFKAYDSLQLTD
jgi:HlyD family secretion protein